MSLAPIVIFCYNRPWHLTQTLNALKKNSLANQSDVHIFCDGPKINASKEDLGGIDEVANICKDLTGFASVKVYKSEINKGLQNSVINGLNAILKEYETVIVVEDDVVTSPYFLQFMNNALSKFENEERVLSIGSWNYFYQPENNFLNHMPDTIAWATWRNKWALFEEDGAKLYKKLKEQDLVSKFNLDNKFDFEKMLKMQIEGKVSSWAIRWTAVAVLNNTLSLYPKISLSKHIGFGADSTNCEGDDYNKNLVLANKDISDFDIKIEEDKESVNAWLRIEKEIKNSSLYIENNVPIKEESFLSKAKRKINSILAVKPKEEKKYGWSGNYNNWGEVLTQTTGYDQTLIPEKVKQSLLKVKNGIAAFERDSVAFEKLEYSEELLKIFKDVAQNENGELNILDFGGSLGSLYFQYRSLLSDLRLKWSVIEQAHFVKIGKENFANDELSFFENIDNCVKSEKPSTILLSSVLAYLPKPYDLLKEIQKYRFKYIILYRTAFIEGTEDRLTLQTVPPQIYEASYPSWFLNEKKLLDVLNDNYEMVHEFNGDIESELMIDGQKAYWKGMILKLKK